MGLIHLPQAKWAGGTGRQVILKSDFDKIEQAVLESFALGHSPSLEYVGPSQVRVNATSDCKARVMLNGFPSPLHRGLLVDGGLSDERYRENATPAALDLTNPACLWGTEKAGQWYAVLAVAGSGDTTFALKGLPVMRVSSQAAQTISLRNNVDTGKIGYDFGDVNAYASFTHGFKSGGFNLDITAAAGGADPGLPDLTLRAHALPHRRAGLAR